MSFRAAILLTAVSKMALVVRSVSRHTKLQGGVLMNPETICSLITELPEGLTVGGNLDLSFTSITALPERLSVGGDLNLSDMLITELPEDLRVGGGIFL